MIGTDSYHIIIELEHTESDSIKDHRNSEIEITCINLNQNQMSKDSIANNRVEPIRAKLLGEGVIRLFREFESDIEECNEYSQGVLRNPGDETMVAIVAIPTYFTATDILSFIGEHFMETITNIRILKSTKINRFMVLLKFSSIVDAAQFQHDFNGKPFNSMEPETCHTIFIKTVEINADVTKVQNKDETENSSIPFLLLDPFTRNATNKDSGEESFDDLHANTQFVELPTCPVCLERMDSNVSGLLTIPCQHTFHCSCLTKWKDDTCPICRYSNNIFNNQVRRTTRRLSALSLGRPSSLPVPAESGSTSSRNQNDSIEHCMECDVDTNLWICLICGNLGCDRYAPEQHSLKHFVNTGHCFAMESATSRVWDYAGDNYVHRLVTNESDGKIVELPERSQFDSSKKDVGKSASTDVDKVDQVGFEYSQLLISQLASQREYYESLLQDRNQNKPRRGSSLVNNRNPTDLLTKVDELDKRVLDLSVNVIPNLKARLSLKEDKVTKLSKDLSTSNSLNQALSQKVEFLTGQNASLKQEITELTEKNTGLNEQVTDLMFFLDNQNRFKDQSEDVKEGTVVVQQSSKHNKKGKLKKKK